MEIMELVTLHDANAASLQHAINNYKKSPTDRKTVDYIKKKAQEIDALWHQFHQVDQRIRNDSSISEDHPYFKRNLYSVIGIKYDEIQCRIETDLQALISKPAVEVETTKLSLPAVEVEQTKTPTPAAESEFIKLSVSQPAPPSKSKLPILIETHTTGLDDGPTTSRQAAIKMAVPAPTSKQISPMLTETYTTGLDDGTTTSRKAAVNKAVSQDILRQRKIIETIQRMINETNADPNRSTQFYIMKLRTIEQHWKNAQLMHEKLWTSAANSGYFDFEDYLLIEENINNGILNLQERIARAPTAEEIPHRDVVTTTNFRLPKIELPTFDGNYLNWRHFHDLFSELIDRSPLPLCQKLLYLKSSLSGEAAGLIQHFATTATNYDAAWDTLKERYENKRVLVNAVIKKLLSQPAATIEQALNVKHLHDTTRECLLSLHNLGIATDSWDPILLHILIPRLNKTTHALWEQSLRKPKELPTLNDFLDFLKTRFQSLEALGSRTNKDTHQGHGQLRALGASISTAKAKCSVCQGDHPIYACPTFLKLTPKDRLSTVQKAKRCINCLKVGHTSKDCTSSTCNKCHKKHNSLLHLENKDARSSNKDVTKHRYPPSSQVEEQPVSLTSVHTRANSSSSVLLSTVTVAITDAVGNKVHCRALLDSGSQANFVTKGLAKRLGLQITPRTIGIEGIGQTQSRTIERINLEISSLSTGFSKRIEAHILQKIISNQPNQEIDIAKWKIPANINLSDVTFNSPGRIDMLIGAGLFYSILCVGQISLGKGLPSLQNTLFGWVVGGEYAHKNISSTNLHCGIGIKNETLNDNMEKFWQLEEREVGTKHLTAAEIRCENHFLSTTRRHTDGRFIVKMPFHLDVSQLGESKDIALQRFKSIERKLSRDPQLRAEYIKFMREYEQLNHMQEISLNSIKGPYYFLPHHAILKPDSTTTKLRVVFDASAKTSTNLSLNDILATGPAVQSDVFTILLRFRFPRYAFTADIEKMYRQVWISEEDRKYQLIWWRDEPTKPLRCMQLSTVTYGTTSAPYLAIRTLKHLASTERESCPLAAEAILNNFYVDDVLSGSDRIATALHLQEQLRQLLHSAGFNLRKWCANDPRLLNDIPEADREVSLDLTGPEHEQVKTMGITWHPKQDVFSVRVNQIDTKKITKRTALADISRLFDPLGLMAPVVVTAKMFLQQLWKLKLDWDAALPQDLHTTWLNFSKTLIQLQTINIPRHIYNHTAPKNIQLHVFADASENAYGAAAYVRSVDARNVIIVRLLCSKSRVAPVKQITLPRLELCAAKLATDLTVRLREDHILSECETYYWSDSTAVLGWIKATSANYHTFVANRISAIQQVSTPQQWHHVRSELNPADLISRGLMPDQLVSNVIWFHGPLFLHGPITSWPLQPPTAKCTLELRQKAIISTTAVSTSHQSDSIFDTINHKNSSRRLQRIMSYVFRVKNIIKHKSHPKTTAPTVAEMEEALNYLVKCSQQQEFADEIKSILRFKSISTSSNISSLTPFLDEKGILRVGGRLQASDLNYDARHPILLPYHHPLTKMIFTDIHKEHLHVGAQTLLSIIRQRFWPLKGKNIARSTVQACIICTRAKPKLFEQLMGALPRDRVQPARPFVNAGVDFFGPVWVHFKLRGKRPLKAYVSVFCCFATKAVHLELVSDLTTEAFLGALRRFMARRGHCSKLYCDNATNFVGANNKMKELTDILHSDKEQEKIATECSKKTVQFIFIPPRAPHFGGLWEAAVKSAKHLLQTTLSSANLTHEEMETVITEAEAIMNSRPLTPMSADPNDLTALTPGHFLIGEPLTAIVDPHAHENNVKPLARWKLVTHLKMEFWRRWTNEYLHSLQHRYKWKREVHDIKPNTMVLIKEDNLPSFKWPLGRITNVIRGNDGLVRVVDVRTATNTIRRPITKLAPLPIHESEISNEFGRIEDDQILTGQAIQQTNCETITHSPKRARLSTLSVLHSALLLCLLLPLCLASNLEVKPFQSNPGLYFEQLGSAGIIVSEWNIVNYVDMTAYWKWNLRIQAYPKALHQHCKLLKRPTCSTVTSLLDHLVKELEMNNELLTHRTQTRLKRGAFNMVGNIANSLFGVLDQEYAEATAKTIEEIRQNENHLVEQLQLQKSFLDSTLSIMKKDRADVESEFQKIEDVLSMTNNQISQLGEELRLEKSTAEFNDIALQTTLVLTYLQRIQESLLDMLTDTHHGKINPELLSPKQLGFELYKIKATLPSSLKLPETSDLLKFYNLMTIEARIVNHLIIFNIKMPLISTEGFEILKLTPIPWVSDHVFKQIKTNVSFLIINLHRDQYVPLEEKVLKSCTHVENGNYICHQHRPIYMQGSPTAACELNLFNQNTKNSSCTAETIGSGPHWIQLHNPNWWLYSTDGELTLNTVCEDKLTKISINNAGLLKLNENCVIKQPFITVRGNRPYKTTEMKAYIPDIDANTLFTTDVQISSNSATTIRYVNGYISRVGELDIIQQNLSLTYPNLPNNIRAHDVHHYLLGYTCFIVSVSSLAYIIWKRRSHKSTPEITNPEEIPTVEVGDNEADSHIITIYG